MTKTIEEIRKVYPENDQDITDVAENYTWELSWGWQKRLTLTENVLAKKDRDLNDWFLDLPLSIKECTYLTSQDPSVFINDDFVSDFIDMDREVISERELQPFDVGYEEQQAKLKSKIIKLKDFKNDREE